MIWILSIVLIALICFLWYEGGGENSWARDLLIPIIVGVFFLIFENWIVGICVAGSCQIIRMGYGAYDPEHDDKPSLLGKLTKDRNGWWIRLISGSIYGIVAPLPIVLHHIFILHQGGPIAWKYPLYIALNGISNFLVCRLKLSRVPTDLTVGFFFALILFF